MVDATAVVTGGRGAPAQTRGPPTRLGQAGEGPRPSAQSLTSARPPPERSLVVNQHLEASGQQRCVSQNREAMAHALVPWYVSDGNRNHETVGMCLTPLGETSFGLTPSGSWLATPYWA